MHKFDSDNSIHEWKAFSYLILEKCFNTFRTIENKPFFTVDLVQIQINFKLNPHIGNLF